LNSALILQDSTKNPLRILAAPNFIRAANLQNELAAKRIAASIDAYWTINRDTR
jgi:hypothetical protein